ncbi:MAG: prepilin-type N-terminal cleavage/methylation domain-containing protein [Phycisphaerales bacterium]|nr:prepilin-type N-terminal cleavage/methylation domain-containing protein [Phycisphaerales bacterium]
MSTRLVHRAAHAPRRRGLTLIEAIAAIVILSVAIPSMLWALRDAARRRVDPVLVNRARWLAGERLEDIIADRHSPTRGYAYVVNANYAAENPVSGFTGMQRTVSIVETGPPPSFAAGTGFKTVTVSVTFTGSNAVSRTLSLATVVTDYTP